MGGALAAAMRRLLLGIGLVSAACTASVGGGGAQGPTGEVPRQRTDGADPYTLELLSETDVGISRGMSSTLRVLYLDGDGRPATGAVYFDLDGETGDARLQAGAVETDADGVAEVDVRAGEPDSTFDVKVSADYANEVRAHVTVTEDGFGDLRVVASYEGGRRVYGADVYLYTDAACDTIEPQRPPPADRLQSSQTIRDDVKIQSLENESVWSVLVLGIGEAGGPVVAGCTSDATVVGGAETTVEVTLADIPIELAGPFSVESHFAITDSLPPDAQAVLGVLGEIADDPNDPATYLLDLLGDELIDSDVIRFAYQAARAATGIDETVNDIIFDYMPDFVWDALQAGDDLAAALEDAQVDSTLTVDPLDEDAEGTDTREARHELVDLVLDLDGVTHRFSIARDMGIHDTSVDHVPIVLDDAQQEVTLGEHEFRIGLGTLAVFAMNEVVLPRFDGHPDNLAEFVSGALPCDWIGEEVSDLVGLGDDDFWGGLCEMGGAMMGQYVEASVRGLDDEYDRMTLQGTATLEDETKDLEIDALDDGNWNSGLSGAAGRIPVAGTFEAHAAGHDQTSNR